VRDQFGTRAYITVGGTGTGGSISIGDTTCVAGNNCTFTVTQTGGTASATVNYATQNVTASGGGDCTGAFDYIAASSTATVGANSTTSIVITTCAGATNGETFNVNISGATSGTITDGTGVGTITGGGPTPVPSPTAPTVGQISIADTTCTSGAVCNFTVTQAGGSGTATITYSTSDNTATGVGTCPGTPSAGADYDSTSGSVNVAAGGTGTIPVTICTIVPGQGPINFIVNLTGTNSGTIVDGSAFGTIADVAGGGAFSINPTTSCSAGTPCFFTISRTGGSGSASVNWSTGGGSATGVASCPATPSGTSDYVTATNLSLSLAANDFSQIQVATCANPAPAEGAETFNVTLSAPTNGATIGQGTGTATIQATP
jgi:hypothetical protein